MRLIGCPKASVINYYYSLHYNKDSTVLIYFMAEALNKVWNSKFRMNKRLHKYISSTLLLSFTSCSYVITEPYLQQKNGTNQYTATKIQHKVEIYSMESSLLKIQADNDSSLLGQGTVLFGVSWQGTVLFGVSWQGTVLFGVSWHLKGSECLHIQG
jgi:hypothetical protein